MWNCYAKDPEDPLVIDCNGESRRKWAAVGRELNEDKTIKSVTNKLYLSPLWYDDDDAFKSARLSTRQVMHLHD